MSQATARTIERQRFLDQILDLFRRDDDPVPAPRAAAPSDADSARAEAAMVRKLAGRYVVNDPGFASDLFEAANRHEEEFAGEAA